MQHASTRSPNTLLIRLSHPAWAMNCGILLGLSMPPYGLYPLAWVALVPLLIRWSLLKHPMTVFREAYVTFLLMTIVAGFWMLLHTSMTIGLLSGAGLLLLPLPHAVAFTLALLVRKRFGLVMGVVALAVNVLAVEFLIAHGSFAFPWLLLGHTQADALLFNQHADLGGVGLLTLGVLVSNILGMLFVRVAYRPGFVPGWRSLIALAMVAMLSGIAVYGDEQVANLSDESPSVRIGIIQPAVDADKWADATDGSRVEYLASLSDQLFNNRGGLVVPTSDTGIQRLDLLIWPEASLPVFGERERQARLYRRLSIWSRRREVALLSGAFTNHGGSNSYYNSAMLFEGDEQPQEYAKSHMVPLAEVIPFLHRSPILDAMTIPPTVGARLGFGDQSNVLRGNRFTAGTTIGSESLHGDYVRRYVADGADILVSLAQNGWWGYSPGATQHLNLTRLRAIETRRAVVVSTVSGTSGIVYPDGRIERVAGWMEEGIAERDVPLRTEQTMYVKHGDWPGRFSLIPAAGLLLLLGVSAVFYRRPNPKSSSRKRKQG